MTKIFSLTFIDRLKKLCRMILLACTAFFPFAHAAAELPTESELFDWAQVAFPTLFTEAKPTLTSGGFSYRGPYSSGNYLGIEGSNVYVLGPVSDHKLLVVGTLSDFACNVHPSRCQVIPPGDRSCVGTNSSDVFKGMTVFSMHPTGEKPHGCQLVTAGDGAPVLDGQFAAKFLIKPGDCSASQGFDDCSNDRSRHEISEMSRPPDGQPIIYETNLYIPAQERFRPRGNNIMFLSQVNAGDENVFNTLAYLEVGEDGALYIRTHVGFTWEVAKLYPVYENPIGKWINVRYELLPSVSASNGYLRVFVDGSKVVDESRATLPSANGYNNLRVGIYNAFISKATDPYKDQVIYFDSVTRH